MGHGKMGLRYKKDFKSQAVDLSRNPGMATTLNPSSRGYVGWSMRERMTSDLAIDALAMGIEKRHPPAGLMPYSDRGSQYASGNF